MKKHIAIILSIILGISMIPYSVVIAASDNGADAHSPSMSVGSGDEPIADESTTRDAGAIDENETTDEPVANDDDEIEEQPSEEVSSFNPIILVVLIPIIGIVLWLVLRNKKKTGNTYKSKH